MKNGGLILWNAFCEKIKTSWQMGRHPMRDDLENQSKARSFLSVQWLNFIRFLRKDQSTLDQFGKKGLRGIFLGYALVAGRKSGKETFVLQIVVIWENLDASEIRVRRPSRPI